MTRLSPTASLTLPTIVLYCFRKICAEKEQHKGILIGRGGSALKQLGTASRAEIEEFLGRPVFLNLSVKVGGCRQIEGTDMGEEGFW
jgi:GTPase Era involved in 16S rRNA processing